MFLMLMLQNSHEEDIQLHWPRKSGSKCAVFGGLVRDFKFKQVPIIVGRFMSFNIARVPR